MISDSIFNLSNDELALALEKNTSKNKLGFAILLKYFQLENRYPKHIKYVDPLMLNCLANQLDVSSSCIENFDWEGRSTERFRREIRQLLGCKKASLQEVDTFKAWLIEHVFPMGLKKTQQIEYAYTYFSERKIEPFTSKEFMRHMQSAHQCFEQQLFDAIYCLLSEKTQETMELLLKDDDADDEKEPSEENELTIRFRHLKQDIPGAKLKNVAHAVEKISCLNQLALPIEKLSQLSPKLLNKYYLRVSTEHPYNIRRHNLAVRYALFSIFCYSRSRLLTDSLSDLLMKLIHKLRTSSESFIDKKILSEVKRVGGKFDILCSLAVLALNHPEGIIKDIIYPEVGQEKLGDIIKEHSTKGKWYENQVHKKMHSVYSHGHRKILLSLLEALTFNSRLKESEPILKAIKFILANKEISSSYYPNNLQVPMQKVISNEWENLVVIKENNVTKIHRINYEIFVLQELHTQLGCKMIWVEGALRYRDPDEDLPKDFDDNRESYAELGLPLDAKVFTAASKKELHEHLTLLNDNLPTNDKVEILDKNGGHVKISPYEPQAEPANIKKLHETIKKEYGTINFIDVLKESELQIIFSKNFHSSATKESLPKEVLRFRLLLCLYGIGTNTGLKCIGASNGDVKYSDLRYVKRRYITVENVRAAIVDVVNKNLAIRDPRIFGEASTGVACDSKKISVWDQNLLVEWHARYRGRGVMVYWHAEKKALCVYAQLKTCSSSEVGSMIKGILEHCTNMEINKAYMDTHGQSTLGFGVGKLLSFDLLPRIKNIHEQKLYYPSSSQKSEYKNLEKILKSHIDWSLIEDNYDEAIRHMAALKKGIMDPEVFVKRFSQDNYQHPVYRTIVEIGKVEKTNFLCRYLMSEELRIEVHEAQNVVERLNSIMGFIFYGKLGEISTNIKQEQELAIVCLHLLQACMAYINTIIFQNILSRPEWQNVLTPEDKRALNVLLHSHFNPYGLFPLDLSTRLGITLEDIDQKEEEEAEAEAVEEELV